MKRLGMKIVAPLALAAAAAGCDGIFSLDNWDPPESRLTGELTFQGEPLGVRINSTFLELWQTVPEYPIEERIDVYVHQDGQFSAILFDGTYEANIRAGSFGWVDNESRQQVVLRGEASLEVPVQPYYTIENETITYNPGPGPGGSITATFNVAKHNTDLNLEYVGVYVGTRAIVDRTNNPLGISNAVRERSRAAIQSELDSNSPITITIPLPDDVHVTPSPARRNFVHVRVGVKTQTRTELVYTQVYKIDI